MSENAEINVLKLKKEDTIFLKYREIQMGSGAKSYMWKGFLIYEEIRKFYFHFYRKKTRGLGCFSFHTESNCG
jgi:hypothetical protein